MLLRRITKHVKDQNWFAVFIDFVIVVVGVFIGIQVANWNEQKQLQADVDTMLVDIESDLVFNYQLAEKPLDFYKNQDAMSKGVILNRLTEQDYVENHKLSFFILDWYQYLPIMKNIDNFVNQEKLASKGLKPIVDRLKQLQNQYNTLTDTYTNSEEFIDEVFNFFEPYPWLVKYDEESNQQRTHFMLNNQNYKNKVMLHWGKLQNYYDKITRYRAEVMAALGTILRVKYDANSKLIESAFQKHGMRPFKVYGCDVNYNELDALIPLRSSALIANMSDQAIELNITNHKNQEISQLQIKPFEMRATWSDYFGIDGDYNQVFEVIDEKGNCINKYGAVENGYLMIN